MVERTRDTSRLGQPRIKDDFGSMDSREHKYRYAYPGEQQEGIRRRIRQGIGGPDKLEVGADVIGHYHVGNGSKPNTGDIIEMDFEDETWQVKLLERPTNDHSMISQVDEDEIGYEIQGTCVKKIR